MTVHDQKQALKGSLGQGTSDIVGRLRHARVFLDASSPATAHEILEPLLDPGAFEFPSTSLRMEALAIYLRACTALGHTDHLTRSLSELRHLYGTAAEAEPEVRVRAAAVIAHADYVTGQYPAALELCNSLSSDEITSCSTHAAFAILAVKQATLSRMGRLEEAGDVCGLALDLAEKNGDAGMQGNVLSWMANLSRLRGLMDASLRMYADAFLLYQRVGYQVGLARIDHNRGNALHRLGMIRQALQSYRHATRLARQCSDNLLRLRSLIGQGMTSLRLGDFGPARRLLLTAWLESRRIGAAREVCLCTEFLGELQIVTGRTAAARRTLRLCRRLAERLAPEGDLVAEAGIRESHLAWTEGKPREAEARARESIDLCVRKGMAWEEAQGRRMLGAARAAQGDRASARREMEQARSLYERMGERLEIRLAESWLAWLEGGAQGEPPPLHPSGLETGPVGDLPVESEETETGEDSPGEALRWLREATGGGAREEPSSGEPMGDGSRGATASGASGAGASAARVSRGLRSRGRPAALHPIWDSLGLVARSGKMLRVLSEVETLARSGSHLLLLGETGTGKELLARGAHRLSGRNGRFVPFNCAGCPAGLVESELFGAERGAYTGADRRRTGLIHRAAGGTLFLDEVGDLRAESQGALLRFLDSGEVRALGSGAIRAVSLGVIAATLRPLDQMLQQERFRADLYYRLAQGFVQLPPLRERPEDLEPLVAALWSRLHGGAAPEWLFAPAAQRVLREHPWKGNVRELRHLLHRIQLRAGGREVPPDLLAVMLREGTQAHGPSLPGPEQIREALGIVDGNRSRAAALLGISRAKLYRLIERSGRLAATNERSPGPGSQRIPPPVD